MNTLTKFIAGIYGIQLFIVLPWFLGAIYRHEQSLAVWTEFSVSLRRHGLGDAVLSIYLYMLLYSAFFVIPFCILSAWSRSRLGSDTARTVGERILLSAWFGATILLFADPIMEFIRHLPTDDWRGWLLILWVFATIVASISFRQFRLQTNSTPVA